MLLLGESRARRQRLHAEFVRQAYTGDVDDDNVPAGAVADFQAMFPRLWKVKWANEHKDVLWRLAVDGLHYVGGAHRPARLYPTTCPCGAQGMHPRLHHFWDCDVALVLRCLIELHLPQPPLLRHHLWLGMPPSGVLPKVWNVVLLAALSALEWGRVAFWRAARSDHGSAALTRRVAAGVCSDFVARLAGFAAAHPFPRGWDDVHNLHPFLGRGAGGALLVRCVPL